MQVSHESVMSGFDIPDSINSFLASHLNIEQKIQLLQSIPKHKFMLEISELNAELAAAIPNTITTLIIDTLDCEDEPLRAIFEALPRSMKYLCIRDNTLQVVDYTEIFSAMPTSIVTLKIADSNLRFASQEELNTHFFYKIPANVTTVDLSLNNLFSHKPILFNSLPTSVTTLNLQGNSFEQRTQQEMENIIRSIPSTVTSLNISAPGLATQFSAIFQALPTTVTTLSFSLAQALSRFACCSDLFKIRALLRAIPGSINTIEIKMIDESADAKPANILAHIFSNLPAQIKSIRITNSSWVFTYGVSDRFLQSLEEHTESRIYPVSNLLAKIPKTVHTLEINSCYEDGAGIGKFCLPELSGDENYPPLPEHITTFKISGIEDITHEYANDSLISFLQALPSTVKHAVLPATIELLFLTQSSFNKMSSEEKISAFEAMLPKTVTYIVESEDYPVVMRGYNLLSCLQLLRHHRVKRDKENLTGVMNILPILPKEILNMICSYLLPRVVTEHCSTNYEKASDGSTLSQYKLLNATRKPATTLH